MNEDTVMPDWLHDIFLGYGDPAQAKYTHMPADQLLQTIDFKVQQQACIWPKVLAACCLLSRQLSLDACSTYLSSCRIAVVQHSITCSLPSSVSN